MKKYYSLIILLIILTGCKKTVKESTQPEHETFCDADFSTFYKKFSTDSLYQKEHIRFPLKAAYLEDTAGKEAYTVEEHIFERNMDKMLVLPSNKISMKKHPEFQESIAVVKDTVNYSFNLTGSSRAVTYTFMKEKDCWFLQRIYDDSLYQPDPFRQSKLNRFIQPFKTNTK